MLSSFPISTAGTREMVRSYDNKHSLASVVVASPGVHLFAICVSKKEKNTCPMQCSRLTLTETTICNDLDGVQSFVNDLRHSSEPEYDEAPPRSLRFLCIMYNTMRVGARASRVHIPTNHATKFLAIICEETKQREVSTHKHPCGAWREVFEAPRTRHTVSTPGLRTEKPCMSFPA
jgi:hypothetical protein